MADTATTSSKLTSPRNAGAFARIHLDPFQRERNGLRWSYATTPPTAQTSPEETASTALRSGTRMSPSCCVCQVAPSQCVTMPRPPTAQTSAGPIATTSCRAPTRARAPGGVAAAGGEDANIDAARANATNTGRERPMSGSVPVEGVGLCL